MGGRGFVGKQECESLTFLLIMLVSNVLKGRGIKG